ncbi:alpha/beta fold hydrolase [Antarcticirhabdus aurantiaca]|uniref:Alpha/beta fold hydrolase n=1 Tax=Antarcticirhabdus aurantiaca TaxID=2606717 RepID=A0ACD4NSU8_9HYPH|nr:alpha/beta fold hydrolase [Antarcticirhabdus aurantiaca]WAJ30040.1 alpha/beta fold hydrolase [Jeongeuplla avenae]
MSGPHLARREWPATREAAGRPVILLHGFDGSAAAWEVVAPMLARQRRVVAFDLPGHGGSLSYPGYGPPKLAARAVLAELSWMGVEGPVHLVGHSMGGAVASLAALFEPERVASLALIAPGGFGPDIGLDPIRAVIMARNPADLADALSTMGAPGWRAPAAIAAAILAERSAAGEAGRAAVASIFDQLFGTGLQGVLPLDAVAAAGRPVTLVWGDADPVTPTAQAHGAPAGFQRRFLEGVGHLPMLEAPGQLAAILSEHLAAADAACR